MSDFETRLSSLLHDATPEPPRDVDLSPIIDRHSSGSSVRALAPLAAVVVIAVIAVVLTVVGGHNHTTTQPAASQTVGPLIVEPSALYGPRWTVSDLHGLDGAPDTIPASATTLVFAHISGAGGTAIGDEKCVTATATVTTGQIVFTQDWVSNLNIGCGGLTVKEANFLFGQILSGTVHWGIRGHVLTISNKSGSVDLTDGNSATPTPQPDATSLIEVQLVIHRTANPMSMAVSGTIEITSPTLHLTVTVGKHGDYTTRLPAGTYTFTGHSPQYNNGQGLCKAPAPVTLMPPHTAESIYVTCEEQ